MSGGVVAVEVEHESSAPVVEEQPTGTAIEDAVQRVLDKCYAYHVPPSQAVVDLWAEFDFDADVLTVLARVGLAKVANDANRGIRPLPEDANARARFMGNFHVQRLAGRQVVSVLDRGYEVAGGIFKPLRQFTLDDLQVFISQREAESKGAQAVAEWGRKSRRMLVKHHAAMIADLPAQALKVLEEAWPQ